MKCARNDTAAGRSTVGITFRRKAFKIDAVLVKPMTELIPRALRLHEGPMKEVGRTFHSQFRDIWRVLGLGEKKTITNYFRQHPGTVYLCFRMDFDNQEPYGRCAFEVGRTFLTFSAPLFALAYPDVRVAVIVHELAHIYRRGSGEWTSETETEEVSTRSLALTWGYKSPTFRDEAHKAKFGRVEEEWRTANRQRFGRELESRWLRRIVVDNKTLRIAVP